MINPIKTTTMQKFIALFDSAFGLNTASYVHYIDSLGMLQNCGDPKKALNMLAQINSQMGALMNMINGSGMSAKGLFMQMAKQNGIDTNTIINALK